MSGDGHEPGWDFFISYTAADREMAEWVAWQLEDADHRVLIQAWDFVPGSNWQYRMEEGMRQSTRTIAIVSPAYLTSVWGKTEWRSARQADPEGLARKLLPIRVKECGLPAELGALVYIDLVDRGDEAATRLVLLEEIRGALAGRIKPRIAPAFPLRPRDLQPVPSPSFPEEPAIAEAPAVLEKQAIPPVASRPASALPPAQRHAPSAPAGTPAERLRVGLHAVAQDLLTSHEGAFLLGSGLPRAYPVASDWSTRASWPIDALWDRLHLACLVLETPAADRWRREIRTAAEDAVAGTVDPAPELALFPGLTGPVRHPGLDLVAPTPHPEVAARLGLATERYPYLARVASRLLALLDRGLPLMHCREGIVAAGFMEQASTAKYRERLLHDLRLVGTVQDETDDVAARLLIQIDETIWSVFPWPLPAARSQWELWCGAERHELREALAGLGRVTAWPIGDYRLIRGYDNGRPVRVMGYPGRGFGEIVRCLRMYHWPQGGGTTVLGYVMVS